MLRTTTLLTALLLGVAAPAQGLALQLATGVDGGVSVPASPLLVPPTGITVEAWVTYDDSTIPTNGNYWPTIVRQNIQNGQERYNFRVGAGSSAQRSLQWIVRVGTQLQNVTYSFLSGEFASFTHLAATYDGQTLRIFKNGNQVAVRALATQAELVYGGDVLRIGNGDASTPGNETWNGVLDEVRIWPMARTGPEIQRTMNQALSGLPGKVLTFPLDGHAFDVSSGLVGNQFGAVNFVPGPLALQSVFTNIAAVGQSTSLCGRSIDALPGSVPEIGNSAFAIWATRGEPPAQAPLGLLVGATAAAPPGLPPLFGVDFAIDPSTIVYQATLIPPTDFLGNARYGLPIPNDPSFPGVSLVFQFGFLDAVCGPQGISASDGVQFTLQ